MDADELNERIAPELARPGPAIPADWLAEFEAAARRPLETRFRYAFIYTYKPVLDDAPFRAFDTTADYRHWCEANLPNGWAMGAFECRKAQEIRDRSFRRTAPPTAPAAIGVLVAPFVRSQVRGSTAARALCRDRTPDQMSRDRAKRR
jgi:hypothetical protein